MFENKTIKLPDLVVAFFPHLKNEKKIEFLINMK